MFSVSIYFLAKTRLDTSYKLCQAVGLTIAGQNNYCDAISTGITNHYCNTITIAGS